MVPFHFKTKEDFDLFFENQLACFRSPGHRYLTNKPFENETHVPITKDVRWFSHKKTFGYKIQAHNFLIDFLNANSEFLSFKHIKAVSMFKDKVRSQVLKEKYLEIFDKCLALKVPAEEKKHQSPIKRC